MFTYFGRIYSYGLVDFIKVQNRELPSIDFIELDGQKLREQFISEIIPEADESRVKRKRKNCTSATYSRDFEYKYIKDSDEVEIRCHWKVKCDFVTKIINKEYVARYDIGKKQFLK
ncbi:MAG: hypothetical protein IPJ81_17405 [Chitinophagaceae bacterium]|nr:hypothetical protein [Chitinophagaceae bacterium]